MDQVTNLANLPLELLELVAESIERERDVNSLVRASRRLNCQLTPHLYHRGTLLRGSLPRRSALRWAATRGRLDTLRRAMSVGVNIGQDPRLLAFAASHGDARIIALILEAGGFRVNARGRRRWTALCWAAHRIDFQLAELLLDTLCADVNMTTSQGLTVMHLVVRTGHPGRVEMARLLLKNGARFDVYSRECNTPLHLAAERNDWELTELLLQYGARPAAVGFDLVAPVHTAIESGSLGVLGQLLEAWMDAHLPVFSESVLYLAAYTHRNHEIADLILESGAGVCREGEAYDVMCKCAHRGDIESVKVFVKHGVTRPKTVPRESWLVDETPLTMAMGNHRSNRVELLRLLLHAGYYSPGTNSCEANLLHAAAIDNDAEIVALLLEAGVDPMAVETAGETPTHEAARMGHSEVVRLLRGAPGVDIAAPDSTGRSPLFHAAMRGFCSVITVLVGDSPAGTAPVLPGNKRDVYGTSPIIAAARNGCRSTVAMLLALDPGSADEVDRDGRGITWWLEKSGCEPLPELTADGVPDYSAGDREWLDGMLGQEGSNGEECWCDVCTRYTVHGSGARAKRCLVCYNGEGFLICRECEGQEAPFCDAAHEKAVYRCN